MFNELIVVTPVGSSFGEFVGINFKLFGGIATGWKFRTLVSFFIVDGVGKILCYQMVLKMDERLV